MKTRKGYKVYPLTFVQRLHFYCLKYRPRKQVLNIGSSPTIESGLDWDVLRECIRGAIVRYEFMRLKFARDKDGTVYQHMIEEETREIEHFDFTGWKEEDTEDMLRRRMEAPFERYDPTTHYIVVTKMSGGYQGLCIYVGHMTINAQFLIVFFRDVIKLYCSRLYEEIHYPREMPSYIRQLEKDLVYGTGSQSSEKGREFFEKMIASSGPIFTDICGPEKLLEERRSTHNRNFRTTTNTSDDVEVDIINSHLKGEPPGKLLDFYESRSISITCPLLMGLRIYPQRENDQEDVSITTTIVRWITLLEKCCGSSRIHCFPFRAIMPKKDTSMEGLLGIWDAQNQYLQHVNYSPSEYFNRRHNYYKLRDGQTHEPLSLTYQPLAMKYDGSGLDKLGDIKRRTVCYSNGVTIHTLYLTVSHRASGNGPDFGLEYQIRIVMPRKLEHIYYYLRRIILRGVEDPDHTIGQVIDIVQDTILKGKKNNV